MPECTAKTNALMPLEVSGLNLDLAGQLLIDGIDLTISEPGVTVIMGYNGAGKSLLLRLLHGLISQTSGTILWAGQTQSNAVRQRQAMVFQSPVLLRRSVSANIDFALKVRGQLDAAWRDELLELVGLADLSARPARLLSGGEQQRLSLARALSCRPDVLLLDEPTANLDPASVAVIEDILKSACAEGVKIIFVTHDIGQAKRLGDEIVFLHQGKVAEQSAAEAFFTHPTSQVAQAYLEGRIVV
ncbi:MAG: ATP-binding cassette domain-containing protein [Alphaproteobacteria bacterium]|nr:ATP-binding cassette domain-containing protein [Alphaproteobacteria bacterium]